MQQFSLHDVHCFMTRGGVDFIYIYFIIIGIIESVKIIYNQHFFINSNSNQSMRSQEKVICAKCHQVHNKVEKENCPNCGADSRSSYDYKNSDDFLKREVPIILEERKKKGCTHN